MAASAPLIKSRLMRSRFRRWYWSRRLASIGATWLSLFLAVIFLAPVLASSSQLGQVGARLGERHHVADGNAHERPL